MTRRTSEIWALGFMIFIAGRNGAAESGHPAPEPTKGVPSSLARQMLAAHNDVRVRLKVPPLQWSSRLAAYAQEWGNTLLARGKFYHRPDSPYGENLFMIKNGRVEPAEVVSEWASESSSYNYRSNKCHGTCGHYTQLVWRGTQRVGCAVARGGRNEIWICNYDPPGNIVGQKPY